MKNSKLICLFLMLVTVFALIAALNVSAVDTSSGGYVYSAEEILSNISKSSSLDCVKMSEDGKEFVRVTAYATVTDPTGTYVKFNFYPENREESGFVPEFKIKDYPYAIVSYRTDMATTSEGLAVNIGMKNAPTGTYERFWGLNTSIRSDEKFHKAIYDVSKNSGFAPNGEGNWSTVDSESGVMYVRIPVWAYAIDREQSTKEYFDVEYIGFFKTLNEAESFGGTDVYSDVKHTVSYIDEDGSVIKTTEVFEGSVIVAPTASEIDGKLFTGWSDGKGNMYTEKIRVDCDMKLKAVYETADLIDKPFMTGYAKRLFKPDNNMTRAEACTVVTRLLVDESTLDTSNPTAFTDLNKDAWYYKYVTYLEEIGYLKSYTGDFKPDQKITRAEFVELVYNMGKITGGSNEALFKDVPADHPRYDVIMAAAGAGLVNGKTADTFDPDGDIKRSEVVKVLCTALGRIPSVERLNEMVVVGFDDVFKEHWAYSYILEATCEHTYYRRSDGIEVWGEVIDNTEYIKAVPEGLVEKFNSDFADRVAKIRASESEWSLGKKGKVIYVSFSEGDDANTGLSPEQPIKTLKELMNRQSGGYKIREQRVFSGDVVLFKRGDEWHEKFYSSQGVTYSAYGEGEKPRLLGSIEADEPDVWVETDIPSVYKYKSRITSSSDVGNIVFDNGYAYGQRIIKEDGADRPLKTGRDHIVSNGLTQWKFDYSEYTFAGYADLKTVADRNPESDLMFYHDREKAQLYLYSRNGNPGELFESIELCVRGHAFNAASNVTVDNLFIGYTGSHGIASGTAYNLTVRNCEIGWVGGSVQGEENVKIRFGNAIEIYGMGTNFRVYNNYIYQCFDCGPTIQVTVLSDSAKKVDFKDVAFYGNALWGTGLEVWLGSNRVNTENEYARLTNVTMYDNYVTMSGYGFSGYNHQNYEYGIFYGGGETTAEFIDCYIYNNRFWNLRWQIMIGVPNSMKNGLGFGWFGNTFIHRENSPFGQIASRPETADGNLTYRDYDNETIKELLAAKYIGENEYYKLPELEGAPALPLLPAPPIEEPFR